MYSRYSWLGECVAVTVCCVVCVVGKIDVGMVI